MQTPDPTLFHPPCGPVRARRDGAVLRLEGLPYARAARFVAPEPVPDWSETLSPKGPAPACPQLPRPYLAEVLGSVLGDLPQDENCQNLTVTLPADPAPGEHFPVMVWIHGGSYVSGAGDAPALDPAQLVQEQRVIVVSVTYRLGLLGFLGGGGRRANLGLLDCLAALRWVQRNIAAFGGDTARLCVFGQSAGADAVAHLMALPEAPQLMTRAILQSPPLGIMEGRAPMSAAMAQSTTLDPEAPVETILAQEPVAAAAAKPFGLRAAMPFGVEYGQPPLPAEPAMPAAWRSIAPQIPVLIGQTAQEGMLFVPTLQALKPLTGLPLIGPTLGRAAGAFLTTRVYTRAIRAFARRHADASGSAWLYRFHWHPKGNPFRSAHAIDLPFLFGSPDQWRGARLLTGASDTELVQHGQAMRALWAAFAREGALPAQGALPGLLRYRRV